MEGCDGRMLAKRLQCGRVLSEVVLTFLLRRPELWSWASDAVLGPAQSASKSL